ncbi:hypothetical protein [Bartonella rattaustraliani]|uniref:hypothetical protein n=1 Tax=Bartonella rattaustraliani TaxID=481139 RepID=UPI0003036D23|nr:hypothetical protein [Bartonella rattaustraliani]
MPFMNRLPARVIATIHELVDILGAGKESDGAGFYLHKHKDGELHGFIITTQSRNGLRCSDVSLNKPVNMQHGNVLFYVKDVIPFMP